MTKPLGIAAFGVGLIAVGWVGVGYAASHPLALAMTSLILAFYLMGALELRRFHQATATLADALSVAPAPLPSLDAWLARLHPSLQGPVRLRIEGERIGLPGPAMTPYLVGLLVLLGMLGTFLGMVLTLNGAVMALESTTDLQAMRASLAAPVKGLGLAFGTSVAGVAASAMLGLVSALCRRERLQASQGLDSRIATVLRPFSLAHQRQLAYRSLQVQAQALPAVLDQLQAAMLQMARMAQQQQDLGTQMLSRQDNFHRQTELVYSGLAVSVDASLKHSLTEGARVAGATIQPLVEATLLGLARQTGLLHETMGARVQRQLDSVAAGFADTSAHVSATWQDALAQHDRRIADLHRTAQQSMAAFEAGFETRAAALLASVDQRHANLQAELAAQDPQRLAALTGSLEAMAASLQREWQQAGAATLNQQQAICQTLHQTARDISTQAQAQASSTVAEIAQLLQSAAVAPRAAVQAIGLLQEKLSDSLARDNQLLDERSRTLATLNTLVDAVSQSSAAQRGAIDALVLSSASLLDRASVQFSDKIDREAARMTTAAAQVSGGAVEVASLGESFGFAVRLFSESNHKLMTQLQRIEAAMNKSLVRSDEQLAYYVAQAREIIDLSLLSQKQIVDDLQQRGRRPAVVASGVA
jgi:hypothetical protein